MMRGIVDISKVALITLLVSGILLRRRTEGRGVHHDGVLIPIHIPIPMRAMTVVMVVVMRSNVMLLVAVLLMRRRYERSRVRDGSHKSRSGR